MNNVYDDVCNALHEANIRKLLYEPPEDAEETIEKLCNLFNGAWPLQEPLLEKPKDGWKAALKKLLDTHGQNILEFSHHRAVDHRGIEHIEENWKRKHKDEFTRLLLEMLAGYALGQGYGELELNVLIVDNKPDEIFQYSQLLPPKLGFSFWENARFFRVKSEKAGAYKDTDFLRIQDKLCSLKSQDLEARCFSADDVEPWDLLHRRNSSGDGKFEVPKCGDIDLVLQDQYLSEGMEETEACPQGSRLAEHYVDVMPQALVFLMTGTDIAELAALGEVHFVDRVISKSNLAALPWYYFLAFTRVLGAMFWDSWLEAKDEDGKQREIFSRWTLRRLLGSVRAWVNEPDILWHGQACAELVDHSQPHVSDLWKMANDIFGARNPENGELLYGYDKEVLTHQERILLGLSIWTHDIGHRGDDQRVDSTSIREIHSSISEGLLLANRKAFGLEWLDKLCPASCQCNDVPVGWPPDDKRFVRTKLPCNGERKLCLLRLTGIVSMQHQSSVPLSSSKLPELIRGLKTLHDYSRLGYDSADTTPRVDSVKEWCDQNVDLEWVLRDVRCLDEFVEFLPEGIDLHKVVCLLRFLDAIDLNRCRAGSRYKIETYRDFYGKRRKFVERECERLIRVLQDSPQSSKAYFAAYEEYVALVTYKEQLLENQEPHLWRQEIVEKREIRPEQRESSLQLSLIYSIREANLSNHIKDSDRNAWPRYLNEYLGATKNKKLKSCLNNLKKKSKTKEYAYWIVNFLDDVVGSELKGQKEDNGTAPKLVSSVFKEPMLHFVIKLPDEVSAKGLDLSLEEIYYEMNDHEKRTT